jgi:acylphosphatase
MIRHLHIYGIVQGVGFRYHFSDEAQRLGVTGWVRNRRGGSVEAVIEGTAEAVEALIAWARAGPAAAQVERVEVTETAAGGFSRFELRPTQ